MIIYNYFPDLDLRLKYRKVSTNFVKPNRFTYHITKKLLKVLYWALDLTLKPRGPVARCGTLTIYLNIFLCEGVVLELYTSHYILNEMCGTHD